MQRFLDNFRYITTGIITGSIDASEVLPADAVEALEAVLRRSDDWCDLTLEALDDEGRPVDRQLREARRVGETIQIGSGEGAWPAGTVAECRPTAGAAARSAAPGREISNSQSAENELVLDEVVACHIWTPPGAPGDFNIIRLGEWPWDGVEKLMLIEVDIFNPLPGPLNLKLIGFVGGTRFKLPAGTTSSGADQENNELELTLPEGPAYRFKLEGYYQWTVTIENFAGWETFW